jgi:flavin reductase (DIM6/NTAB) family NADH-FMN oxidoreductase RutF
MAAGVGGPATSTRALLDILDLVTPEGDLSGGSLGLLERSVDATSLRHVMGHFATGVAVVTAVDDHGQPVGTTVNAITSVSLEPPLVLVCLGLTSTTLRAVRERAAFAINVLGADHGHLASGFARRGALKPWRMARHQPGSTGTPRLEGVLAGLECRVEHRLPLGDHELVVGRVIAAEVGREAAEPLVFYRGTYSSLRQ